MPIRYIKRTNLTHMIHISRYVYEHVSHASLNSWCFGTYGCGVGPSPETYLPLGCSHFVICQHNLQSNNHNELKNHAVCFAREQFVYIKQELPCNRNIFDSFLHNFFGNHHSFLLLDLFWDIVPDILNGIIILLDNFPRNHIHHLFFSEICHNSFFGHFFNPLLIFVFHNV